MSSVIALSAMLCVPGTALAVVRHDDGSVTLAATDAGGRTEMRTAAARPYGDGHGLAAIRPEGQTSGGRPPEPDGPRLAGPPLPVDGSSAEDGAAPDDGSSSPDAAPTEPTAGEFSGSATPAGPDLTPTEEEDLISGGWK